MIVSEKSIARALNNRRKASQGTFNVKDFLFAEQLAFIEDPSRAKIAVCSRRSGKTVACAADLVNTALKTEGVVCLYITLSRNNAKKIIWREIKKINREYKLGGIENLSELSMVFPNNSIIYLSGAKDTNEIEKFRGLALKLVYIDEAQSFREYIKELIDDVLSPALMDYAGTLVLIGTPPPIPTGFFCDAYQGKNNWSKHHWTFWNNPFIIKKSKSTHQEMLDYELKRKGVTYDDPSIQREWYGTFVQDKDSLLIHYDQSLNHYKELPDIKPNKYIYLMGIDLGFDDADAIAVLAWQENSTQIYLVEEKVVPQQGLSELVEQIQQFQQKYDISKMVIDQGGLGKKLAEEMRRRHQLPVEPADKARKMENIAFLNDALRTGRFKASYHSKFAQDSFLVEIDKDKSTPEKVKVSDKYHSDIIDAVLYAFRESPAYAYVPPIPKPSYGSKAWALEQEKEMFEKNLERLQEEHDLNQRISGMGWEE
jgi:PBSX family phage terminase large subunit